MLVYPFPFLVFAILSLRLPGLLNFEELDSPRGSDLRFQWARTD